MASGTYDVEGVVLIGDAAAPSDPSSWTRKAVHRKEISL